MKEEVMMPRKTEETKMEIMEWINLITHCPGGISSANGSESNNFMESIRNITISNMNDAISSAIMSDKESKSLILVILTTSALLRKRTIEFIEDKKK